VTATLLASAGYPPAYPEPAETDADLAPVRAAIDHLLNGQEPYPAWVTNRWWNIVAANCAAHWLLAPVWRTGMNLIEVAIEPGPWRDLVENWPDVARHCAVSLRHALRTSNPDPRMSEFLKRAEATISDAHMHDRDNDAERIVYPRFRAGSQSLETVAVVAQFGIAHDVTMEELRVHLLFPADPETDRYFRGAGR
jgi:hypothetical protein